MDQLVADTSVLIDLERGGLIKSAFRLPYRFVVPDLLYRRELMDRDGAELLGLGLARLDLTDKQLDLTLGYRQEQPALSESDAFCLALASSLGATLLTGDGRLRALAVERRVPCHGVLWLLDELLRCGTNVELLHAGLRAIQAHPRCRLPRREVNERLSRWAGSLGGT